MVHQGDRSVPMPAYVHGGVASLASRPALKRALLRNFASVQTIVRSTNGLQTKQIHVRKIKKRAVKPQRIKTKSEVKYRLIDGKV